MLKRISAHKLLLILVIVLIARPAMSVMAHDLNMAMGNADTTVHCHDEQPEKCQMSLSSDSSQKMSCDKCSDSCSSTLAAMISGSNKTVVLDHPYSLSTQSFVLCRRIDNPFRPPIHS